MVTVQAKTNLPLFHQLKKKVRECVCVWVTPWLMTYLTTQAPVWIPGRGVCLKTTLLHSPCQSSFIVEDCGPVGFGGSCTGVSHTGNITLRSNQPSHRKCVEMRGDIAMQIQGITQYNQHYHTSQNVLNTIGPSHCNINRLWQVMLLHLTYSKIFIKNK